MNAEFNNKVPGDHRANDNARLPGCDRLPGSDSLPGGNLTELDRLLRLRYEAFSAGQQHDSLKADLMARIADVPAPAPSSSGMTGFARFLKPGRLGRVAAIVIVCTLALCVLHFVPGNRANASVLFASVMQQIRAVSFVTYNQSVSVSGSGSSTCRVSFSSDGLELRRFDDKSVQMTDLKRGRISFLPPESAGWTLGVSVPPESFEGGQAMPWLLLTALADGDGEAIASPDNSQVLKFIARGPADERIYISIDRNSRQLVGVEIVNGDIKVSLSDFDWSEEPVDIWESVSAPGGATAYYVDFSDVNTEPTHKDLVDAIGILSAMNADRSPDSLEGTQVSEILARLRNAAADMTDLGVGLTLFSGEIDPVSGRPAPVAALESWRRTVSVTRGLGFLKSLTKQGLILEYNGGVDVTAPDSVILRYRSPGGGRQWVILSGDIEKK